MKRDFFAPCPKGLEYLLVDELREIGASDVREALAGVHFSGEMQVAYRACLWSRLASRILLPLHSYPAADEEALYRGALSLNWQEYFVDHATFAVDANTHASTITHSKFAALRIKDAIVDQYRDAGLERPNVDTDKPDFQIRLDVRKDVATLSLDMSGNVLFHRGYRRAQGDAPLKENLAAAMLLRAGWPEIYKQGGALVDPMCGSATLLIEAAWMAADVAPGLQRQHFGFFGWRGFDNAIWQSLVDEANQRASEGLKNLRHAFYGSDNNANLLGAAKSNTQAAGVAGFIQLAHRDVAQITNPFAESTGLIISNPPYGERMGEFDELAVLYRAFGDTVRKEFADWQVAIITSEADLARATGLRSHKRYKLFNGALECLFLLFKPASEQRSFSEAASAELSEAAQGLRNRIEKNRSKLRKWIDREAITCYRVYDADIPEYSAAIDVYGDHLHIQEYAAPAEIPQETARRRMGEIVRVAAEVFECPREKVAIKTRRQQTPDQKYARVAKREQWLEMPESGLSFLVNIFDYLDTGLFLDHRPTRARIRELASGKHFLNLFCYTASATVYAADGGAVTTTSVDLSAKYLEWADRNLDLNDCIGEQHRLIQADVMSWLESEPDEYDLIFIDPPSFSNSKKAEDFDVQKHHVELLTNAARILAQDGVIIFSCNLRSFKFDADALAQFEVHNTSKQSIPPDFERDQRIHQCFELRLKPQP